MRKRLINVAAVAVLVAAWVQPAAAFDFNFRIATWNVVHTPTSNITVQLFPAAGASVYRGQIVFHRGTIPTPRIVFDAASRIVTLHYGLAEFPVVSNLLENSSSTFVNYSDSSGTAYAYLYTNHAP